MEKLGSVRDDWIAELVKGYIVRFLICQAGLDNGFEEQLKDVKQEMFLSSSFYIRLEPTIKGKHLRRDSKSLDWEKSIGREKQRC